MGAELTIAIVQAILTYGPSAVMTIANAMQDKEVTADDIKALFIDKEPGDYFE